MLNDALAINKLNSFACSKELHVAKIVGTSGSANGKTILLLLNPVCEFVTS
jgi:hypothetical protein